MNAQLVILDGFNIVVTDEEIKEGDWVYNDIINDSVFIKYNSEYNKITGISREIDGKPFILDGSKKIIASTNSEHGIGDKFGGWYPLPSVDYNGFEEDLNIIDIEKIACKKYYISDGLDDYDENYYNGGNVEMAKAFINGFNYSESLNKKEYSQEDMKKFGLWLGENFNKFKNKSIDEIFNESPFNKKSNVFDIEVEMEDYLTQELPLKGSFKNLRPKIINNKIKITKIL